MGDLKGKIEADFASALKKQEIGKISTLRLLKNAIHNLEIKKGRPASSEDIYDLIRKEIKQREDSIQQFKKGGRSDLAQKEQAEIEILSHYLPPSLSPKELEKMVKEAIIQTKASSANDINKVMANLMPKLKGRASGSEIFKIVSQFLKDKSGEAF